MSDYFIFTEIKNCGKVGKIALDSFHKYHNLQVFVYGTQKDFDWIVPNENNIFLDIEDFSWSKDVIKGFDYGHLGTAKLWARIILDMNKKYCIHFDSDVIFRGNLIDDLISKSKEGYDLIGQIRNYKNNPINEDRVRHLSDVVSTSCFLFNKEKLSNYDYNTLYRMCKGEYNPLNHLVLDFFDPVSFDLLKNGAKIHFLSHDDVGGCDNTPSRDNCFKEINNGPTPFKIDFGRKISHFSGVGSGMNFYNNKSKIKGVSQGYINYCIDRYALFCKVFYNEDIGIDVSKYKYVLEVKEWY